MRNEIDNSIHALVLNDNELEAQLIEMLLSLEQIECSAAASEIEAHEVLNVVMPDIIIASWHSDSINGRDIVCRLKRARPRMIDVPGLLITDRKLSFQQRMECTREGFNWIVQAPFTPENFANLVKLLINERTVPGALKRRPIGGVIPQGSSRHFRPSKPQAADLCPATDRQLHPHFAAIVFDVNSRPQRLSTTLPLPKSGALFRTCCGLAFDLILS